VSDDYAARQAQRDREYLAAFDTPEARAWIENMPADERQRLEAEGLLKPLVPGSSTGLRDEDLADSTLASETPDMAAAVDPQPTATEPSAEACADALASFCARIRSTSKPLLVFDAVCFATGILALDGRSQTELAKQHGVSRAAFSKIATQWCKTFGLKPSRGMKSKKARATYAQLTREKWSERNRRQSRRAD
jgi:hypothetical protein